MKKIMSLLCALLLLSTLAACQNSDQPQQTGETNETTTPVLSEPGYTFVYNGTEIAMKADAAAILATLGDPVSCTEQTSCAFSGLDKTFYFGSFYMDTYPVDGADYVYSVWLADDTVTTAEGLYIGATQAQVESIYGTEGFNGSNAYIMTKGASKLTIILEDGLVISIQYDAVF